MIEETILSKKVRDHIDHWIKRYPKNRQESGVFEALRVVQEENNGSLTVALMDAVADYLAMPKIAVYEVATFYTMYFLQPMGKHVVDICTNVSCALNGATDLLEHCKSRLGIGVNETTSDGKFSLREVECLGACVAAPACMIGKQYYTDVTKEKMDHIIEELKVTV